MAGVANPERLSAGPACIVYTFINERGEGGEKNPSPREAKSASQIQNSCFECEICKMIKECLLLLLFLLKDSDTTLKTYGNVERKSSVDKIF